MKKGKSVKINLYPTIKSIYGTVDSKNLKSIYINIQSWVSPKNEQDNWNRIVGNLNRQIKHSVLESINTKYFLDKSIVDLDLRVSGISHGKKSFFNLEVNLFLINEMDFKSSEIKDCVKKIVKTIFRNEISTNKYFDFTISKKIVDTKDV